MKKALGCLVSAVLMFPFDTLAVAQNYIVPFPDQVHQDPLIPFPYVNPESPTGGSVVFGEVGTFDTFYPFFLKGQAAEGSSLLHATLFKASEDEASAAYPYVAESVEIEDQKITFTIRKEAFFSDKSLITPEDVVFSFYFLTQNAPLQKQYYEAVLKAEKSGPEQVTFLLKPNAAKETALILSGLPVLSKKFFESHNVAEKPFSLPVSSGPYVISQFKPGAFVTYERVADWWGNSLPCNKGFYNFQKVTYQ